MEAVAVIKPLEPFGRGWVLDLTSTFAYWAGVLKFTRSIAARACDQFLTFVGIVDENLTSAFAGTAGVS